MRRYFMGPSRMIAEDHIARADQQGRAALVVGVALLNPLRSGPAYSVLQPLEGQRDLLLPAGDFPVVQTARGQSIPAMSGAPVWVVYEPQYPGNPAWRVAGILGGFENRNDVWFVRLLPRVALDLESAPLEPFRTYEQVSSSSS
eukprot:jgi/Botrbrau1/20482/Bobra.145_2s0042.1